jgi:hypothetical protein
MKNNFIKILLKSLIISVVGVLVIDYFFHLFFSNPMETPPYFMAKMTIYFIFSIFFLSIFNFSRREFLKVSVAGVVVSSIWGIYYNILPVIFNFFPFGIPLRGLTFLGMGLFGTGLAFGTVHALAFIGGHYSAKFIFKNSNQIDSPN